MTPRELPKYEVIFSFRSLFSLSFFFHFDLVGRALLYRAFLAGRAHPIQKSFPKPLPVQLLKDRELLSKLD